MNAVSLEATLQALQQNRHEIDVPEPTRKRALGAIQRMLEVG
jgi:quinolinate synthase